MLEDLAGSRKLSLGEKCLGKDRVASEIIGGLAICFRQNFPHAHFSCCGIVLLELNTCKLQSWSERIFLQGQCFLLFFPSQPEFTLNPHNSPYFREVIDNPIFEFNSPGGI